MGVHVESCNGSCLHAPNSSAGKLSSLPKTRIIIIALNEYGKRIGETHQNARISNETVDRIRELHEDDGLGYLEICQRLNMALTTVRKICRYERRADTPSRWDRRKVQVSAQASEPRIEKATYVKEYRTYTTYRVIPVSNS